MNTRFDTESRIAVAQATDIARELGHREVGPGHLLLGLLANARGQAYAALRAHGLDFDSAREIVATHHVEDDPAPDDEDDRPGYAEDRDALKAIGIDLDRVREAVRANLGDDVADGWADRPEGGRRGRRGRRHRHHGQQHHGRGRRGPRSSREDGPRFARETRALLRDVRRSVLRDRLDTADRDSARTVPGMTGARLLVAITRSDDPATQAVLATVDSLDALQAQAEAAVEPHTA